MTKRLIALSLFLLATLLLAAACSRPSTVREFFDANASDFQELVDEMNNEAAAISAAAGIEMTIDVEIVGDHTIRLDFVYGPNTEFGPTVEADLAAEINAMRSFQVEMARGMRSAMRIDTLYIQMRYLDSTGRVLAEGTFAGH